MKNRTILLVEDNPNDEELTLRAFKRANIANPIVVARDGVEALEYLLCTGAFAGRNIQDIPSVVLLDLKLPRIDGLDVLRALRNDTRVKTIPVVVLTSSNEEQDLIASYQLGANSFIRKPVDFNNFGVAVAQLGLYWLVLNEPPPHPGVV